MIHSSLLICCLCRIPSGLATRSNVPSKICAIFSAPKFLCDSKDALFPMDILLWLNLSVHRDQTDIELLDLFQISMQLSRFGFCVLRHFTFLSAVFAEVHWVVFPSLNTHIYLIVWIYIVCSGGQKGNVWSFVSIMCMVCLASIVWNLFFCIIELRVIPYNFRDDFFSCRKFNVKVGIHVFCSSLSLFVLIWWTDITLFLLGSCIIRNRAYS